MCKGLRARKCPVCIKYTKNSNVAETHQERKKKEDEAGKQRQIMLSYNL
jgi:hypothetical protein